MPGNVGAGAGEAFGADGQDPGGMAMNSVAMRYADGEVFYSTTDLASASMGNGWGQTRFYANNLGYNADYVNGTGWLVAQMPFLVQSTGPAGQPQIVSISGPNNMRYFNETGNDQWQEMFFLPDSLVHDAANNQFVLTDSLGNQVPRARGTHCRPPGNPPLASLSVDLILSAAQAGRKLAQAERP